MGRKRDQLAVKKPKGKAGAGKSKRRQQDPATFKDKFKLNAINKRKQDLFVLISSF
jgi:hypothetical protein